MREYMNEKHEMDHLLGCRQAGGQGPGQTADCSVSLQ